MIVDDNAVPYPRQYYSSTTSVNEDYAGYVVPFAGAPAYYYWWADVDDARVDLYAKSEAKLQAEGFHVRTYRFPGMILPRLRS